MLKLFLDNGQNVNAIDEYGKTILMCFVAYKNTEAVRILLGHKDIDLNIQLTEEEDFGGVSIYKGEAALDIARRGKMDEIVAMLEKVTVVLRFYFKIIQN